MIRLYMANRICPYCKKGDVWYLEPLERKNQDQYYCKLCGMTFADGFVRMADKRSINRQELPLKIKASHIDDYYGVVARCPSCDSSWIMKDDKVLHYCPSCGKAVEWE